MTDLSPFDPTLFAGATVAALSIAEVLEAVMLICFGLAWPAANFRMLQTRQAMGKGLAFTVVILAGYLCGAASKLILMSEGQSLPALFWLYALNTLSVAVNLGLQWHYRLGCTRDLRRNGRTARSRLLTLVLAAGLWTPMAARAQASCPPSHAGDGGARASPGQITSDERRFTTAYGRFVRLADRGDAAAASAALFMFRNGKALFGSDWSATEGQQALWNALAINAARYQLSTVSNGSDD